MFLFFFFLRFSMPGGNKTIFIYIWYVFDLERRNVFGCIILDVFWMVLDGFGEGFFCFCVCFFAFSFFCFLFF